MFQTHKAADEVGGVCYFEYGDNQHARSFVVSATSFCRNSVYVVPAHFICWLKVVYTVCLFAFFGLNPPVFVLH